MTQLQTRTKPQSAPTVVVTRLGSPAARAVLWVLTAMLFLAGIPLTVAGAIQERDYFTTPYGQLQTDTAAMVTREIDVEGGRPTDPQNDPGDLARVRIQVRQADPSKPIFIGIARRADVERYLSGTAYDEMSSFEMNPLRVNWQRHSGRASAPPPGDQPIWAATSRVVSPGVVELQWDKSLGEWMAVAMNSDGSPALNVSANIGLRFGFLFPAGLACLVVALGLSGALIFARSRTTRKPNNQFGKD